MTSVNVYSTQQADDVLDAVLPDTTGATAGQVLTLDANLQPVWS